MSFNNSGRLRHRMELQTFASTGDYADGDAWTTCVAMHCELTPMTGKQSNEADARVPVITHKIRTRFNDQPIAVGNRWLYGTRIFSIDYVIDPSERGDFIEMGCTEIIT